MHGAATQSAFYQLSVFPGKIRSTVCLLVWEAKLRICLAGDLGSGENVFIVQIPPKLSGIQGNQTSARCTKRSEVRDLEKKEAFLSLDDSYQQYVGMLNSYH
jgi:hypothetical protein